MTKRCIFENLAEIKNSATGAEVDFVVESLSPVKKASSGVIYFHGKVADESKEFIIVGFEENLQTQLAALAEKKQPVKLQNCQIKRSRTDELEIHLGRGTSVLASPKKIDIPTAAIPKVRDVESIRGIDEIEDGDFVNCTAKVIDVAPARPVSTGVVQDVTIGDGTATINLFVWEADIGTLDESITYNFKNLHVRTYRDEKTVTLSRQSSFMIVTCGLQLETNDDDDDELVIIKEAVIVGTHNYTRHYSCVKCSNRLTNINAVHSRCSHCSVLQSLQTCKSEVAMNILFDTQMEKVMLKAFTATLINLLEHLNGEVDLNNAETILLTKS